MYVKDLGIGYLLDFYGNTLPEYQRDVLTAYYFEDLSLAEIAEETGIPEEQVTKKGPGSHILTGRL